MGKLSAVRRLYSMLIASTGLPALQRRRLRRRVTIVTYHDIAAEPFARHLAFLARCYRIIPLGEAMAGLAGSASLPDNCLVITFDDGFASFYSDVYPVLQRFQTPATVYLTTGFVGSADILWFNWVDLALSSRAILADVLPDHMRGVPPRALRRRLMSHLKIIPNDERLRLVEQIRARTRVRDDQIAPYRLMTWEQAAQMERSGLVSCGGHTRTHPILARVETVAEALDEIAGCAADLQRHLGTATRHFAYPNGERTDFNQGIARLVQGAGFASAVCALRGTNGPGDDLFALRRIAFDAGFSLAEVAAKLSGFWIHVGGGGA